MKFKSLRIKLAFIFGLCLLAVVAAVVLYGVVSIRDTKAFISETQNKIAVAAMERQLLATAGLISHKIKAELEVGLDSARILADVLSGIKDQDINLNIDRDRINGILRGILEGNERFLGVYTCWEPNALDGLEGEDPVSDEPSRELPPPER